MPRWSDATSDSGTRLWRKTMKQLNNGISGFTLIELLVVIFIIGTLTGIILPNFVGSRQRARDARRKHDLLEIKSALRMYYNDNQSYIDDHTNLGAEYINEVPQDPLGGDYDYCTSGDGEGFVLCADLENEGDSDNLVIGDSACDGICATACDCGDTSSKCYFVCGN